MNAHPTDWASYWEELPEGQLLFRPEADECVRNLTAAVPLTAGMKVLDFGCGYGFVAEELAGRVAVYYLWDVAASMREHALAWLARFGNVSLLDLSHPDGVPADVRLDLILVNSVVQYMQSAEFASWLVRWRGLLAAGGQLVLSDLIPPGHRFAADLLSLVWFSIRRGYLFRALGNVAGEHRRYLATRQTCPLHRVGRDDLLRHARAAGLGVRFLPRNLTHFTGRLTAILTEESKVPRLEERGETLSCPDVPGAPVAGRKE
jgi:SAM-dependent methyltransferase